MSGKKDTTGVNRRTLLKGIGAAVAVSSGASSSVAAADGPNSQYTPEVHRYVEDAYTPSVIRETVEEQATDVITALAESGYIEAASTDEFDLDTYYEDKSLVRPEDRDEGTSVTTLVRDGKLTAHVMVSKNTPSHDIALYVQPEIDRSYAIIRSKTESNKEIVLDPKVGETTVEPNCELGYCCETTYCVDEQCSSVVCGSGSCYWYTYRITADCCPQPSGSTNCYEKGRSCDCSNCSGFCP